MARQKFSSMDEYFLASSKEVRSILKKIRAEVKSRIPTATETISYNIPAFKDSKVFFFFAGFKKHIGVYPPVKDKLLKKKLKPYMNEKGNLAFHLDQDIPIKLIGDIAKALWKQSQE